MILKFTDEQTGTNYYLKWSSIVDAPVGNYATEKNLEEWAKINYPKMSIKDLKAGIDRVRKNGSSASDFPINIRIEIRGNRAGEQEEELTVEEIIKKYCNNDPR